MKSIQSGFAPVGEVMAAEDVEHDTDRDPDPEKQERELQVVSNASAKVNVASSIWCPFD